MSPYDTIPRIYMVNTSMNYSYDWTGAFLRLSYHDQMIKLITIINSKLHIYIIIWAINKRFVDFVIIWSAWRRTRLGINLNLRKSLDTVLRVNQGRINSLNFFANVILYCCNITLITCPFLIVNCIAFF